MPEAFSQKSCNKFTKGMSVTAVAGVLTVRRLIFDKL